MINKMRTFICSIVFLDLVGFSKQTVDNQIILKESLNELISKIISDFPESEHIFIDCGDGAAVGFVGDPEYALFFAINLRNAILRKNPGMVARIGINLGPVKLVEDLNGHPNLIGDGINVAQRIMDFAEPNQITVSRSFHEVTSCLSKNIADLYIYLGSKTDKHVRKYQVYAIANTQLNLSGSNEPEIPGTHDGGAIRKDGGTNTATLSLASKRNMSVKLPFAPSKYKKAFGLSVAAIIAAVSFALLYPKGKTQIAKQNISRQNNSAVFATMTSARKMKHEKGAYAHIRFKVTPQGVLFIDGKKRGLATTIGEVAVEQGEHTIIIKHEHYKDYRKIVHLDPNENILIEHNFKKGARKSAKNNYAKTIKSSTKVSPSAFTATITPK